MLQATKDALQEEKTKLQKLKHTHQTTLEQLKQIMRLVEDIAAQAAEVSCHCKSFGVD